MINLLKLGLLSLLMNFGSTQKLYNLPVYNEDSMLSQIQQCNNDFDALSNITSFLGNNQTIGRRVLIHTICQSWNLSSITLIQHFNNNSIDIYEPMTKARACIRSSQLEFFNNLTRLLPEDSPFVTIIDPCYLWAQNMTHVFIKIKFSMKLDVPGVLEVNRLDVNITMPQFTINAYSFEKVPLRFLLRITTYKFLNPNHYRYHTAELGQIVFEVLKSPSPYFWRNIHSDWFYNPPNQYIWWDMYYQYREQLQVAFGLIDDAEDQRETKENLDLVEEDALIRDKRRFQEMIKAEAEYLRTEFRHLVHCMLSPSQQRCTAIDGNNWSSWI